MNPLDLGRAFWRLVQAPGNEPPDDDKVREAGRELLKLTEAERRARELGETDD